MVNKCTAGLEAQTAIQFSSKCCEEMTSANCADPTIIMANCVFPTPAGPTTSVMLRLATPPRRHLSTAAIPVGRASVLSCCDICSDCRVADISFGSSEVRRGSKCVEAQSYRDWRRNNLFGHVDQHLSCIDRPDVQSLHLRGSGLKFGTSTPLRFLIFLVSLFCNSGRRTSSGTLQRSSCPQLRMSCRSHRSTRCLSRRVRPRVRVAAMRSLGAGRHLKHDLVANLPGPAGLNRVERRRRSPH
eukprot:SAG31_NODE_15_length_37942_cov_32.078297_21_plen_243_part_00